jgi:hypothetical protein
MKKNSIKKFHEAKRELEIPYSLLNAILSKLLQLMLLLLLHCTIETLLSEIPP